WSARLFLLWVLAGSTGRLGTTVLGACPERSRRVLVERQFDRLLPIAAVRGQECPRHILEITLFDDGSPTHRLVVLLHMSTQQTALITGASTGIGYELAKLFAGDRFNLVLIARSGPRLSQVAEELRTQHGVTV